MKKAHLISLVIMAGPALVLNAAYRIGTFSWAKAANKFTDLLVPGTIIGLSLVRLIRTITLPNPPQCNVDENIHRQYELWGKAFYKSLLHDASMSWWQRIWLKYFPPSIHFTQEQWDDTDSNATNYLNRIFIRADKTNRSPEFQYHTLAHEFMHYAQCHSLIQHMYRYLILPSIAGSISTLSYRYIAKKIPSLKHAHYIHLILPAACIIQYEALLKIAKSTFLKCLEHTQELEAESLTCIRLDRLGMGANNSLRTSIACHTFGSISLASNVKKTHSGYPTSSEFLHNVLKTAQLNYYKNIRKYSPSLTHKAAREKTLNWIKYTIDYTWRNYDHLNTLQDYMFLFRLAEITAPQ